MQFYICQHLRILLGQPWKRILPLVHLAETGHDLLKDDWCRCAESLPDGSHAVLAVVDSGVYVDDGWDDVRGGDVWLGAA